MWVDAESRLRKKRVWNFLELLSELLSCVASRNHWNTIFYHGKDLIGFVYKYMLHWGHVLSYIYFHKQKSSIGFLFLHGFTLRLSSLFIKPFWAWLLATCTFAN